MENTINNNMDRYFMYLRKSRKDIEAEAHGEGETLLRHQNILTDLYRNMGIADNQVDIFKEIVSGESIATRPVMQQILNLVEQDTYVGGFVIEVERLARGDTMDQGLVSQTFKYSNTKIITPMKTYDPTNEYDEEYFEFGLFMSRREYKTINRRLRQGMLSAVKEGKYVASTAPYGYNKVKLKGQKGHSLKINDKEADVVKLIFELYINGTGISTICNNLRKKGVLSPTGNNNWERSSIRQILCNPVYIGKIRWENKRTIKKVINGKVVRKLNPNSDIIIVDGLHEAIIDEKVFNKANDILKSHTMPKNSCNKELKNPLSSLLKCELCGHTMARTLRGDGKSPIVRCNYCNNHSSVFSVVEDKLIEYLKLLLSDYKLKESESDNSEIELMLKLNEDAFNLKKSEIKTLQKQKDNLYDLLEQNIYDNNTFIERSNILKEKLKNSEEELDNIIKEREVLTHKQNNRKILIPKLENIIDTYFKTNDMKLKNDLLKSVLYKIDYKKVNPKSPDDFTLTLYPKIF